MPLDKTSINSIGADHITLVDLMIHESNHYLRDRYEPLASSYETAVALLATAFGGLNSYRKPLFYPN